MKMLNIENKEEVEEESMPHVNTYVKSIFLSNRSR